MARAVLGGRHGWQTGRFGSSSPLAWGVPALLAVAVAWPTPASAASKTDPAQIQQRLEYQEKVLRRPEPDLKVRKTAPARPVVDKKPLFVLRRVVIEGNGPLSRTSLEATYQQLLGKKISLDDVGKITERMTRLYREQGFMLSRAFAPPQDITSGILRIRLVAGSIVEIEVSGDAGTRVDLSAYTDRILAQRPLTLTRFERQLLLISDIPGLTVTDASLEETGNGSGRFKLTIMTAYRSVDGSISLDNRGTADIGPWQLQARASANSISGAGDVLTLGGSLIPDSPRESRYIKMAYNRSLGGNGARIGGLIAYSQLEPDGADRLIGINSEAVTVQMHGRITPLRSRVQTLRMTASLQLYDFDKDNTLGKVTRDRLRTATLRADYNIKDDLNAWNYIGAQARAGIGGLGASERGDRFLSNSDGHADFVRFNLDARRTQPLFGGLYLIVSASAQLSLERLLSSEEFNLGGSRYGHGYDGGELSGEDALAGYAELRYGSGVSLDWMSSYQIYGFYDLGTVWNRGQDRQSLSSAGGGVRLNFAKGIYANAEIAVPLTFRSPDNSNRSPRAFIYISKSIR